MSKIAIVYHTQYGHTKLIAENVAEGARKIVGTEVSLLTIEEATAKLAELESMDAIIFGAPTYMATLSAGMKAFFELTAPVWMEQKWSNKIAGGFTTASNASGDKVSTLQNMVMFAMQHGMIWVGLNLPPKAALPEFPGKTLNVHGIWLGVGAQSTRDEKILVDSEIETAQYYGKHLAEVTAQFVKGRA